MARRKAFVILDGILLSIGRVGMGPDCDRAVYSGKHKRHRVNTQIIAAPAGQLMWGLVGAAWGRHDMGAAREHRRCRLHASIDTNRH